MKKCKTCPFIGDPLSDFFQRNRSGKTYPSSYCKECERRKARESKKARYHDPAIGPQVRAHTKERTDTPEYRDKLNSGLRERYATDEEYRQALLDNRKERRLDPEKGAAIRETAARSYQKNKCSIIAKASARVKADPKLKLRGYMRSRISEALAFFGKRKDRVASLHYLPYSWDDLYRHLESQFEDWMNFSNYGPYDPNRRTWQVDHVVSQVFFPYDSMDSDLFRMCWDLRNLRPLEAVKNLSEGDRTDIMGPIRDIRHVFQEVRDGLESTFQCREDLKTVRDRLSIIGPASTDLPSLHAGLSYLDSIFVKRFHSRTTRFPSLIESVNNDWELFRVIVHCVKKGERITPISVISNLRFVVRTPGHFFPSAATAIWKAYHLSDFPSFDPFLGWGGRTLGASAANVHSLIGCDLQPESVSGCRRVARDLGSEFEFHEVDVLQFLRSSDKTFGFVFTSPPFMDTEDYGVESDSMRQNWLDDFVLPLAREFRRHLAPGGKVALHLKDLKGAPTFTAYHSAMMAAGFKQTARHKYGRTWTQAVYVYEVST